MPQPKQYSNGDLINTLIEASESVDDYLGQKTYRRIKKNNWPAPKTFSDRFGSWREAKQAAGLPARRQSWGPNQNTLTGAEYYDYVKSQVECVACGEDYPAALAFHHPPTEQKQHGGDLACHAPDRIREEIDGCIITCFNCHQKHHNDHELNLNEYPTLIPPKVEDVRTKLIQSTD